MKFLIWFDFKKRIKQGKTWFLIIILFIVSISTIKEYQVKSTLYNMKYDSELDEKAWFLEHLGEIWVRHIHEFEASNKYEIYKNSCELMRDTGTQARIAARNKDYKEYNRLMSFVNLMRAKERTEVFRDIPKEAAFIKSTKNIWEDVSGGIEYKDTSFPPILIMEREHYNEHLLEAKYYHYLYIHDFKPIENIYHLDSMTFPYIYFNKIIPLFLGLIVLVLMFDSINEEWANGSIKLVLTQPISRGKYILSKIISGVLNTLFVILLPAITVMLRFGMFDLFKTYNYPVLILKDGFSRFKPIANFIEYDLAKRGYNQSLGFSLYSDTYKAVNITVNSRLDIIPLYKFLLLVLVLLVLGILFYITLNVLISSMTKNKIIGFIISLGITLVGIAASSRLHITEMYKNKTYNFSPFSMNNPVRILDGTYNTTALVAILILGGLSIILLCFNIFYFRNKDL